MPGPAPTPIAERVGHIGQAEAELWTELAGGVVQRPEENEDWHPIARGLFRSHIASAQTMLWQSSDWWILYLVCENISRAMGERLLGFENVAPGMRQAVYGTTPLESKDLMAILKMLESVLSTAESRRRARVSVASAGSVQPTPQQQHSNVISIYQGVAE